MTVFDITEEVWKEGAINALNHHVDGASRTEKTYQNFKLTDDACALCSIFNTTESNCHAIGNTCQSNTLCPLYEHNNLSICNQSWRDACYSQGQKDFPAFHTCEVAQVALLEQIIDRGYDAWFGDCIARMKGEEIECKCSCSVSRILGCTVGEKAIFKFTGEYSSPENKYSYDVNDGYARYYVCDAVKHPILEFVRIVGGPEKASKDWSIHECDDCTHEFEPAKPAKPEHVKGKIYSWSLKDIAKWIVEPEHVKGEVIELALSSEKEKWVFTGEYRNPVPCDYFMSKHTKEAVIFADENWIDPRWIVEPAKPEYKVGDIVMAGYPDNSPNELREISKVEGNIAFFANGKSANLSNIERHATEAEVLKFWEDKCTVTRNGVVMRAYEDEDGETVVCIKNDAPVKVLSPHARQFLKALGLEVIPYSVSKGVFTSPE